VTSDAPGPASIPTLTVDAESDAESDADGDGVTGGLTPVG
jgi:hypothetical protein